MRLAVAILASLVAFPATADLVHKSERMAIRFLHSECAISPTLISIVETQKPEWKGKLLAGVLTWEGREIPLCWALDGMNIFVIDSDGDAGVLPTNSFKVEFGT